jgi:hypothetical protein
MEDDSLQSLVEIQKQLLAIRCEAAEVRDPKLRAAYLHIAELIEIVVREFDRAKTEVTSANRPDMF